MIRMYVCMRILMNIVVDEIGYIVVMGVMVVCILVVCYLILYNEMVNDIKDEDEDGIDDRDDPFDI